MLRWEQIKDAENIEGIKYPLDFDLEKIIIRNSSTRRERIKRAQSAQRDRYNRISLKGIKYPSDFDPEKAYISSKGNNDYRDFSLVKGLRWKHFKNIRYENNYGFRSNTRDLSGIKYPSDFDIENVDFRRTKRGFVLIKDSDFSLVKGLRWEHIKDCDDLSGIKYPPDFDIENAELKYKYINDSDFSLVKGLRWEQIKYVRDKSGIKYPSDFDIENANFNFEVDIRNSDFSLVKGLRWEQIKDNYVLDSYGNKMRDLSGIKYPSDFDIENAGFSDKINITYSDFRLVKKLRCKHLEGNIEYYPEYNHHNEENLRGIKYPEDFDIENVNLYELNISGGDFRLVKGLRWKHLVDFYNLNGIKYPEDFDIENSDFWTDISIADSDFSLVKGLRWKHIKDAKSIRGIKYPPEFDINNADFSGKDISYSDFSLIGTSRK